MQPLTVDPNRLRATVEKLAAYPTRHTLTPGLTEAANWVAEQYRAIPGITAEVMTYTIPKGRRVPEDQQVVEVVATLKGESDRIVLVGGHLDSVNMQAGAGIDARAPGANDDASGVALALECARVLAGSKPKNTIKFIAFSGEEQGLNGSRALSKRAKDEAWKLEAVLSCDMVGNSSNNNGQKDIGNVRVFSEEATAENPNPQSRELARFVEFATRGKVPKFGVKLVMRRDRFGRGGDHTPFHLDGFAAVRFVEVHEEYTRQHSANDLPEFMDWNYLANVTRINALALGLLGNAELPPKAVRIVNDQSHDTVLNWDGEPGQEYVVYWRDTASALWKGSKVVRAETIKLVKINKDDHFFAVGAVGGIPVPAR